jgi:hypothetical protein
MPSSSTSLERAVLEALTYSDIFDYPLRFDELHRYLPVRAEAGDLSAALASLNGRTGTRDDFHFLAGRAEIVEIRKRREARSRKLLPHAIRYGKILGALPFVRMVALTGSLAALNSSKNADFDYMLVAARGRVWTARAFALLFNRFARLFGHTVCPNLIVSESALAWQQHDLYSARELCQMIPITGMDVYREVIEVNDWARQILPNAWQISEVSETSEVFAWKLLELLFRNRLGDKFESWEMTRKIVRFSQQPGFGEETIFTAEVCQGNFHHHRKWTKEIFEERLHVIARRALPGEAIPSCTEIASRPAGSSQ